MGLTTHGVARRGSARSGMDRHGGARLGKATYQHDAGAKQMTTINGLGHGLGELQERLDTMKADLRVQIANERYAWSQAMDRLQTTYDNNRRFLESQIAAIDAAISGEAVESEYKIAAE